MASPLPASTRFFQLPELVDLVLRQLPKKSLLPLQRVNHLLKFRIEQSTALQEKLCLTPQGPLRCNDPKTVAGVEWVKLNSLVYDVKTTGGDVICDCQLELNALTMLERLPFEKELIVSADTSLWWRKEGICFFLLVPQGLKKDSQAPITPSWRSMFLTQPPVTHVRLFAPCKVSISEGKILEGKTSSRTLANRNGVKIADVVDTIINYADTEYLQMAPYAVQVIFAANKFEGARRQYKSRLQEHLQDWKRELNLYEEVRQYQVQSFVLSLRSTLSNDWRSWRSTPSLSRDDHGRISTIRLKTNYEFAYGVGGGLRMTRSRL